MPSLNPCISASRWAAARSTRACRAAQLAAASSRRAETSLMIAPAERSPQAKPGITADASRDASTRGMRGAIDLDRPHQTARQSLPVRPLRQQVFFSPVRQTAELDEGG